MAKFWNKRRKKSVKLTFFYISLIIIGSLLIYGFKQIKHVLQDSISAFQLQEIEIKGNYIETRSDILIRCGLQNNSSRLMEIDPNELVKKLLHSPYIKNAAAVTSLPSMLRISIEERKPCAFVYGRGLNLIDADGVLIPVPRRSISWNLPFITGINEPLGSLGQKTRAVKVQKAVEILDYLQYTESPLIQIISEIDMSSPKNLKLRLVKGGAEVRIDADNYQENLFILNQYFNHYLNWNKLAAIEYFDVRFKDQLVIKEKKS